jgi:CheY-like chemotaxis protein
MSQLKIIFSVTRRQKGLGLGLAIVRNLVELQGGTVTAASEGEGKGATFTVSLPALTSHAKTSKAQLEESIGEEAYATLALSGLRILVVDDERDARDVLTTMLSQCQAHVKAAAPAADALVVLTEWQPDVLVSDIEMPETDGYTFIRGVRAREARHGRYIPAVALTAHAKVQDRLLAMEAGFQTHVSKPVDLTELALAVSTVAGRRGGESRPRYSPEIEPIA